MDRFTDIQRIVAANLGVAPESVLPQSKATDFSAWDSLRHLILIMEIEQTLNCKFDMEEVGKLDTVEKIAQAVQRKTNAAKI